MAKGLTWFVQNIKLLVRIGICNVKSGSMMFKKDHIFNILKSRIIRQEYKSGEKLPSETLLAAELGVSRLTLRSALSMLQENGLIRIKGRSGSYVNAPEGNKKYLVIVAGEDLDHIRISNLCQVQELEKALAINGDELEIMLGIDLKKKLTLAQWQKQLVQGRIAGIFVCTHTFIPTESDLMMLEGAGLPVVQVEGIAADRELHKFPMLLRNMQDVFADGVRHLCTLDHQRIASLFAYNDMRGFSPESYRDFLESCNIGKSFELVRYFRKKNNIPQMVRKLMRLSNPPSAFMCFCDSSAKLVIEGLNSMGYDVPKDVSVMGICGYLERLFITPPLSIVNFHYDIAAQEAVKIMYRAGEWFNTGQVITRMIPHSVIPRGSTGWCRRGKVKI